MVVSLNSTNSTLNLTESPSFPAQASAKSYASLARTIIELPTYANHPISHLFQTITQASLDIIPLGLTYLASLYTMPSQANRIAFFTGLFSQLTQAEGKSIASYFCDHILYGRGIGGQIDQWCLNIAKNEATEEIRQTIEEQAKKEAIKMEQELSSKLPGYIPRQYPPRTERANCLSHLSPLSDPERYKQLSPLELASDPNISPYCKEHAEIILGVKAGTNRREIEHRFRQLSKLYHPDKDPSEKAKIAYQLMVRARETLLSSDNESAPLS